MNTVVKAKGGLIVGILTVLLLLGLSAPPVQAVVDGIEPDAGNTFTLIAKQDYISSPDSDSILMWGYANGGNPMQYPGPTLIVQQGTTISVNLLNELPPVHGQNVSIVFPGHVVTATGGVDGALTKEAQPNGPMVTYTFTATHPGTFMYKSGTRPDLQVEMGLVGAIVVRPNRNSIPDGRAHTDWTHYAYDHEDTAYNHEYLYLVTEIDVKIHDQVEIGNLAQVDTTTWYPVTWMVNGRAFPDLLQSPGVPWLPTQPYNCVPRIHPFETMLIRVVGAGRAQHPMHYHGQDFSVIGINGRMLSSNGGTNGPDLAWKASTFNFTPGQTADMLWRWEGSGLGWDIYGHAPGDPIFDGYEDATSADHQMPFPVILAERDDLSFGQFWSGSPFLGGSGDLPPSHPGLNSQGAYLFPWHSHSEKELTTNDIFPGGSLTFVVLEHPEAIIDPSEPIVGFE